MLRLFKHSLRWTATLLLAASDGLAVPATDDVVVIVNRDNLSAIDRATILRIYTGAIKGWSDGNAVLPFDLSDESSLRKEFSQKVLGRSPANLRAIWSQNIFTGKGLSPKVLDSEVEVKQMVARNRNAVGYVRASQVDASVRVIEY